MSRTIAPLTIVLLLCAGSALAQSVEITPTFGYVFGGDLDNVSNGDEDGELNIEDSEEFGLTADFMTREGWGLELLWMKQSSNIEGPSDFFQDSPGASVSTFHIGGIYQFRRGTSIQPFVVGTMGASQLDSGGRTHNGFSYAGGGGAKFYFGDHFGIRVEGSMSNTHYSSDDEIVCDDVVCYGMTDNNNVLQFHAKAGFIFRF